MGPFVGEEGGLSSGPVRAQRSRFEADAVAMMIRWSHVPVAEAHPTCQCLSPQPHGYV